MNLLSLTYLGNIQYYSKLCLSDCVIDIHENYQKQSYRNRCDIVSADGVMPLSINIMSGRNGGKTTMKEARIDYSKRWQHQHWRAIESAYRSSPFFDFYADDFAPFYTKHYEFLLDFNIGLMELVMRLLRCDITVKFSDRYIDTQTIEALGYTDLRHALSPKPRLVQPDPNFCATPYWQLFLERHPFAPNVSIIDLLFCEGPNAMSIIDSSTLVLTHS